jgi:unsaturated rhamnogalacturonyl hydrolase
MTDLLYDDVEVSLYIPFVPGGSGPFSGDRPLTMAFEAGIDYNSSMSDETRKGGSMERRDFIRKTLACGGAAGLSLGGPTLGAGAERAASTAWSDPQVDKVKIAMLSMQRMAWEQGTAAQAILEWGDPDLVVLMAKEAVVRISEDGRLGQINDNHGVTDPGSNGEAVLYAAKLTGDPALKAGADRMLDYLINKAPKTKDGTLYHIDDRPQVWIDSMYMAPPFLAVAGRPDEAMKQIEGFRKLLWNKEKQLFSHIWDDAKRDFGRRAFWGVGNGWAAAGMTRVLKAMPASMGPERAKLAGYIKDVVDGCLAWLRPDGFFHDVVDDPKSFVETNLAQIMAYTICRGLKDGRFDASYKTRADKMRDAARSKVDRLGLVRDVCGSPTFEAPGTATEGQAFFILLN